MAVVRCFLSHGRSKQLDNGVGGNGSAGDALSDPDWVDGVGPPFSASDRDNATVVDKRIGPLRGFFIFVHLLLAMRSYDRTLMAG